MKTIKRKIHNNANKNNKKLNTIVILIYFIILLILEITIFQPYLSEMSIDFSAKEKLNSFYTAINENLILLSYILCSKWIFILICIIIFNFSTIYKLFIFCENIFIASYIISIIQLLIQDELVYFNEKVKFQMTPCVTFFGTPSVFTTLSTVGIFTLRHLYVLDGFLSKYKRVYLVSFIGCLLYILFISLINLISFLNRLDQIIFGVFLGFGIYFFMFYILDIRSEKGRQLLNFIKKKFLLHFILTFFPLVLLAMTYIVFKFSEKKTIELNNKIKKCGCPDLNYTDIYFQEGKFSLIFGSFLLLNYVILITLKLEYNFIFPRKDNDWMHYNFNNDAKSILEESFCSDISIGEKETRWNKTSVINSLVRFFIACVVCFGILFFFQIYSLDTDNITFYMLYNSFLPMALIFIFLFFIGKCLFRGMNLSNECVIILSG